MKKWFEALNPTERRFVVFVGLLVFIVVNLVWVRPHFYDWGKLKMQLAAAQRKQQTYDETAQKAARIQSDLDKRQSANSGVPDANQAIEFLRTIQTQAAQSGVQFVGSSKATTSTNKFFIEQMQTIKIMAEENQLVDFLFKLGEGSSLVRVRGMSLRPDPPRNRLSADITLVASYQKQPAAKTTRSARTGTSTDSASTRPADNKPVTEPAAKPAQPKPPVAADPRVNANRPAGPVIAKPPPTRPAALPGAIVSSNRPVLPSLKLPTVRTSPPAVKPTFVPPPPPTKQ